MNKLKNVGISALVGTLASLSVAQAGGVSVGGTMEMSYTILDRESVTGHPLGTKKNITFSGGGEFANGWTFGIMHAQNDGMSGLSSSSMNINMGGIATLAYDSGTGSYGANAVDNIIPIAWEEIDYGLGSGISDVGQVSKTAGVVNFTIRAPGSGTGISYSYATRMGTEAVHDGGTSSGQHTAAGHKGHDLVLDLVNIDSNWFGWRLGAAAEKVSHLTSCENTGVEGHPATVCTTQKEDEYGGTGYTSLRIGPFSAGYQATYLDNGSASASAVAYNHSQVWGAAFTVGDYLSFSWGKGTDRYTYNNAERLRREQMVHGKIVGDDTGEQIIATFEGASAAANWGPLSLKYAISSGHNQGGKSKGVGAGTDKHQEINLSMAF